MENFSHGGHKTVKYDVETPLSCLATNKDGTQVVVAGRNVIQVFSVDNLVRPPNFNCKGKMTSGGRPVKSGLQQNSSISDVAWSTNDNNRLATASTNGSITIWTLSKLTEHVTLAAHTRSAHKVLFCNDDPNLFLSASQDSTVKFFDIRDYGSASHPTVSRQLQMPIGRSSPVRDVQYCPYDCYHLAVANENGELQLWDVRQTQRYILALTCHTGAIMCIDWNPNRTMIGGVGVLATAGCRDHLVKVWEVPIGLRDSLGTLCSIKASNVNRICWRKEDLQLASSSNLNIDLSIHIWDIKRPFIPYASFEGHTDLVTGIRWSNDRDAFFSVGKDGMVIRHSFNDAEHLVNSLTPIASDISPDGNVSIAVRQSESSHITTQSPTFQKFQMKNSIFKTISEGRSSDMNIFINLARKYKLNGDNIRNLCEYNSNIAKEEGDYFLTNLWKMLGYIYGAREHLTSTSNSEANSTSSNMNKRKEFAISSHHRLDLEKGMTSDSAGRPVAFTDSDTNRDKSKPDISTGNSDEYSDSEEQQQQQQGTHNNPTNSFHIAAFRNKMECFQDPLLLLFNNTGCGVTNIGATGDTSGVRSNKLNTIDYDDDDDDNEEEYDDDDYNNKSCTNMDRFVDLSFGCFSTSEIEIENKCPPPICDQFNIGESVSSIPLSGTCIPVANTSSTQITSSTTSNTLKQIMPSTPSSSNKSLKSPPSSPQLESSCSYSTNTLIQQSSSKQPTSIQAYQDDINNTDNDDVGVSQINVSVNKSLDGSTETEQNKIDKLTPKKCQSSQTKIQDQLFLMLDNLDQSLPHSHDHNHHRASTSTVQSSTTHHHNKHSSTIQQHHGNNAMTQKMFYLEGSTHDITSLLSMDQRVSSESKITTTQSQSDVNIHQNTEEDSDQKNLKQGPLNLEKCEGEIHQLLSTSINQDPITQHHQLSFRHHYNHYHHHQHQSNVDVNSLFNFFQDLVDQNCLQTVCTAVIILDTKNNNITNWISHLSQIQIALVESWFQAYINLLIHYQLWTTACSIVKLCPCPQVSSSSQQSTTVTTKCGKCNRILDNKHSTIPTCNSHLVSTPTTPMPINSIGSPVFGSSNLSNISGSTTTKTTTAATAAITNTISTTMSTNETNSSNSNISNSSFSGASTCVRHPTNEQSIVCSVCRLRVHGEFLWCHGCGHGGHQNHLSIWFQNRHHCATGCGHKCNA